MSKMVWDQIGERRYETGIEQVALYQQVGGAYPAGVAWNGVTALNLSPSGAEPTPLYANNRKYLTMMSVEELGGTIEAYMYPDEWAECDGSAMAAPGVFIGQQARKPFGLVGKTLIGNDTEMNKYGYKLHLIYGGLASPSEQSNSTINDSPEAKTMSWEFNTTPVAVNGFESTSYICIDSTSVDEEKLKALEAILYGSEEAEPRLPLPDEVLSTLGISAA
jgi:hypothetical protein